MSETVTVLILLGGLCGFAGLVISLICVACIVGFVRSTHTVQYVPLETPDLKTDPEVLSQTEAERERELLEKVGPIKKKEKDPFNPGEEAVADITQTDTMY